MFSFEPTEKVLLDPVHHEQFERDGYIMVPFLPRDEVEEARRIYQRLQPSPRPGTDFSIIDARAAYRVAADGALRKLLQPHLANLFDQPKITFCCFIAKVSGADSAFPLHQDQTAVDESRYSSVNVWCPLLDLDDQNGPLWMLKGGHRLRPTYRGPGIPKIVEGCDDLLRPYLTPLYPRAGEAVIFDRSIIHASPTNRSTATRIVVSACLTHREADILVCRGDPDLHPNQVEVFHIGEEHALDLGMLSSGQVAYTAVGRSLGFRKYEYHPITSDELAAEYGPPPLTGKPSVANLHGRKFAPGALLHTAKRSIRFSLDRIKAILGHA